MNRFKFLTLPFLFSILLFSCKKEAVQSQKDNLISAQDNSDAAGCGNGKWTGVYATFNLPYLYETDATFINNGIAKLTNSPWSIFYTTIRLPVPGCRKILADTVKLEVSLKNPSTEPDAIADYDVALWLYGTLDTAHVQYIGYRPQFTSFGLNKKLITNDNNLLYVFENWTTLSLEAKNRVLTTKKNETVVETLSYKGLKIGRLRQIEIAFKGSGSVDWVKLYSTNTNALIMQEDFNVNGQSTVTWY